MKKVSYLVMSSLMCSAGAAVAAPVEINGEFNVATIFTDSSLQAFDVQIGDRVNTSIFVDDSAFDPETLLSAIEEPIFEFRNIPSDVNDDVGIVVPIEQQERIVGRYPNLASFVQQFRTDAGGNETLINSFSSTGTSVFSANNFVIEDEDVGQGSTLFDLTGLQIGDSIDFLDISDDGFIRAFNGEPETIIIPGIVAYADDNWFERSQANGITGTEMLADSAVNFLGYIDGFTFGIDVNPGDVTALGQLSRPLLINEFDASAGTEDNPVLPAVTTENGFEFRIPEDVIVENETIFFDPVIAVGYTYEVSNMEFASVTAPSLGAVNDPDGYEVFVNGVFIDRIDAEEELFFDRYGLSGVTKFVLQGISTDLMLDPTDDMAFITGLSFTNITGDLFLTQTPITVDTDAMSAVPLPAGGALLLGGFALLAGLRRRKA